MDATSNTIFSPVQQNVPQENGDGPDYSYSLGSKALIITSVALFAIAIVGIAVFATMLSSGAVLGVGAVLLSALAISGGIAGGVLTAFGADAYHTNEIAERELAFAKTSDNFAAQLKYYSKTAQNFNIFSDNRENTIEAIKWEYTTGKDLMLKALRETDEKVKSQKFEEGLKIFENSADHTCYSNGRVEKYLSTHSELRDQLKKEFNDSNSKFEDRAIRYWNHIVDHSSYNKHWEPATF